MRYQPKTKPFKHQSRATLRAVRQRNHAIFFEPRLGKTKAALDYVGVLALKGEVKRVLVVAPAIALSVWESELEKHFPYFYEAENFDYKWATTTRIFAGDPPEVRFFLAGREETFRAVRRGKKLVRSKQEEVKAWAPDVVILDESHEYKRPGARGAQDAWRLVRRLRVGRDGRPYVLLLTGTPSSKGLRDLFAQFRIMDETLLGTNAGDFDEEYVVYGQGPRRFTVLKYRNERRLRRIIHSHSTTCTAAQAGLEGKLFWQLLRVDLPPRVKEAYRELALDFCTTLESGEMLDAANPGVKHLRLQQITSGYTTGGRQIHGEKLASVKRYLEHLLGQDEPAIVYARFTAEVDAVAEVGERLGYRTQILDGRTNRRDRASIVGEFQRGRATPLLVSQVQAGSMAIELSRAAEVVFASVPVGWVTFWQCLNRVRGPNQKRPVRVTGIVARGTVDISDLDSLRRKSDWHQDLMKAPRRYLFGGEA